MRETLCTIPINDILRERDGCPVCRMRKIVEQRMLEYTLGDSMMEPDTRQQTNLLGFCERHLSMLKVGKNRLALALMLKTHLDEIEKNVLSGGLLGGPKKSAEKAENIEKSFDNTAVLKDISFSLSEGEALAIIGSSGSGKTTLLRCLNFLEKPSGGKIYVKDQLVFDAADPSTQLEKDVRKKRLHFGLVFQNFNLFPQYTALQNVMLSRQLLAKEDPDFKKNKKQIYADIEEEARELLKKMNLSDRASHYPHQLSGGQQQRVAIARALALHPDILCFDEPTSALDPELTGEVLKVIRELADDHVTMIIVTHEMAFARDVADNIIFMDDGVIEEQGKATELINNPQTERLKNFLLRVNEE